MRASTWITAEETVTLEKTASMSEIPFGWRTHSLTYCGQDRTGYRSPPQPPKSGRRRLPRDGAQMQGAVAGGSSAREPPAEPPGTVEGYARGAPMVQPIGCIQAQARCCTETEYRLKSAA